MRTFKPGRHLPVALLLALLAIAAFVALRGEKPRPGEPAASALASPSATPFSPTNGQAAGQPGAVPLRPLAVSLASASHEWTRDDATDPKVIEKIAHNPEEFIRLVEENDRIERRQLVYRKQTVPALLDRARANGRPLTSFTLPGLDGMEVEVEVTGTQLNLAANGGSVTGRVKGRLNSMVSVGFANGCESFNVLSPDDGLFLTADAREPGEVLVKEIVPEKYNPPAGDTPDFILTNQPAPGSATK